MFLVFHFLELFHELRCRFILLSLLGKQCLIQWTSSIVWLLFLKAVAPKPGYLCGPVITWLPLLLLWKLISWREFLQLPFVCLLKAHLQMIISSLLLELFSCMDVFEESYWNRSFARVVWEVQLTCVTAVCHFPCLLVPWAGNGNGSPSHVLTYLSKLALIQIPTGVRTWSWELKKHVDADCTSETSVNTK